MNHRKTTEQFIQEAQKVHGNKYDYSEFKYVKAIQKSVIICPRHGRFLMSSNHHISQKSGCYLCAREKTANKQRATVSEFISKARSVHGDKYDYSKIVYKNNRTPVCIVCPQHGEFFQSPSTHLSGSKCFLCNGTRRMNIQRFILDSQKLHGNEYDYSRTILSKDKHPKALNIICKKHGAFDQDAGNHMRGVKCPKCRGFKRSNDDMIASFVKVHGNKYDYSSVRYINTSTPITIICRDHGEFSQLPTSHRNGNGCPLCAHYGFNPSLPAVLYLLAFDKPLGIFWKIGITNRTVEERFGPDASFIICRHEWYFDDGIKALKVEKMTLKKFNRHKAKRLLFNRLVFGGETECFDPSLPTDKVIKYISKQVDYYLINSKKGGRT